MGYLKLLENDKLRSFIYDKSERKVLISCRAGGKTFALLFSIFLGCDSNRKSVLICPNMSMCILAKDKLINLCESFGMQVNRINGLSNMGYVLTINKTQVYIVTDEFGSSYNSRGTRIDDIYIEEPALFNKSIDDILNDICLYSYHTKGNRIIIAGTPIKGDKNLPFISANPEYNRHHISAEDVFNKEIIKTFEKELDFTTFKNEVLAKF